MTEDKTLFKHHHFKSFKKGARVYRWLKYTDWVTMTDALKRFDGVIIKKRSNSVTILWKNYGLEKCYIDEVIDKISLKYEPNDLMKQIL